MKTRHWIISIAAGLAIAAAVASFMTFVDWRLNPGGIFQTPEGTAWDKVYDTFSSWFVPVAIYACALLVVVSLAVIWIRNR